MLHVDKESSLINEPFPNNYNIISFEIPCYMCMHVDKESLINES